jgi:hypothetical protein
MVTAKFVASHSIIGFLTSISALSGKMFWAKIVQIHSHNAVKIPSTNFFIL